MKFFNVITEYKLCFKFFSKSLNRILIYGKTFHVFKHLNINNGSSKDKLRSTLASKLGLPEVHRCDGYSTITHTRQDKSKPAQCLASMKWSYTN